jgi:ArsR family metal-binding transcriptional regulator
MLIENYDLELLTPACDPGAERHTAKATLASDIAEVLPYLNATLPGATYYPAAQALIWKKAGHSYAFHAHEIAISNIEDRASAETELKETVALVNSTWERRSQITPSTATRQRPTAMAVYKLLPRTNCKQCGEATCFIFAGKLVVAHRHLADCPPLSEAQYAAQRAALETLGLETA